MVRLNAAAFRPDVEWWHAFLGSWNGVAIIEGAREEVGAEIWTDASGSWGCGVLWDTQWCQVAWAEWPDFAQGSIAAKELLPIIVATAVWGGGWRGGTVLCHCEGAQGAGMGSGGAKAVELQRLDMLVDQYIHAPIAPSTRRVYAAGEQRYQAFCNHHPSRHSYAGTWFTWQKGD